MLFELVAQRIVAPNSGVAFELADQRIERRIGMMRRAEILHLDIRSIPQSILQGDGKARFSKAGLARNENNLAGAASRTLPAPQQQVELLLTADERG